MIHIKTEKELEKMRVAGRLTAIARKAAADAVKPGVTTWEIDRIVRKTIEDAGAKPSFLGYGGFPGSACVSLNDQVIHGIPSKHAVVKEGDIVKVDVGAYIGGFHGDCACTVPCGEVSEEAKKLIAVTRQSFFEGIKFAREGYRGGGTAARDVVRADIGDAVRVGDIRVERHDRDALLLAECVDFVAHERVRERHKREAVDVLGRHQLIDQRQLMLHIHVLHRAHDDRDVWEKLTLGKALEQLAQHLHEGRMAGVL